ncbi:hypothetical protein B0A48_10680 [Cryoendolithus antarcticus]|uniref:Uncharacterized protein n=1 Tax=Cryoendolithus antarcticus TaxID=1507870 RepID=A0A1V8SY04_9PEZI|nr:hypothetical protein B0A48_10680 [Cryoendolithus antarcticus]
MDHPHQQPDTGQYAQQPQDDQQSGYFDQVAATHHQAPDLQHAQQPAYADGQPQAYDQGNQHGSHYGQPGNQYQQQHLNPDMQHQQLPYDADQPNPQYVGRTASRIDPQMYQQAPKQQVQYVDPQAYQPADQQSQQGQYIPQPGFDPQQPQYMPQTGAGGQQPQYTPHPGQATSQGQWQQPVHAATGSQRSQHAGSEYGGAQTAFRAPKTSSQVAYAPSKTSSRASTARPAVAPSSHGSQRTHRSLRSQAPQQFAPQPQTLAQMAGHAQTPSQAAGYPQAPSKAAPYTQAEPQATQQWVAPSVVDPRHVHFLQASTSTIPQQPSYTAVPPPANPAAELNPNQRAALRERDLQSAHQRITYLQSEREAADVALAHQQSLRHAKDPDDAMLRRVLRLSLEDYTAQFGTDEEAQVAEALRRSQGDAPDMDDEELGQQIHVAQMRSLEELAERLQRRVIFVEDVGGASRVGGSSRRHGNSRRGGEADFHASSMRSETARSSTARDCTPRPHRDRTSHVRSPLANAVPQFDVGSVRSWAPTPTFQDPPLASAPAFVSYDPPIVSQSQPGIPPPRPLTPTPPVSMDAAQHARNVEESERARLFAEHARRYGGQEGDANGGDQAQTVDGGAYDQ